MASSLTITTGELSTTISTPNDEAAQTLLLNFAYAAGGHEGDTPQQLLDRAAATLADYMQTIARERYVQRMSATIREDAENNIHW